MYGPRIALLHVFLGPEDSFEEAYAIAWSTAKTAPED